MVIVIALVPVIVLVIVARRKLLWTFISTLKSTTERACNALRMFISPDKGALILKVMLNCLNSTCIVERARSAAGSPYNGPLILKVMSSCMSNICMAVACARKPGPGALNPCMLTSPQTNCRFAADLKGIRTKHKHKTHTTIQNNMGKQLARYSDTLGSRPSIRKLFESRSGELAEFMWGFGYNLLGNYMWG